MDTRPHLLGAALAALLLPAPLGLALPLAVRALGLSAPAARALVPWGAAALVTELASRRPPAERRPWQARRLTGTLRRDTRGRHALAVEGGLLPVRLADDLSTPPPGTPLTALARVPPGGPAVLVDLDPQGPPRGAWLERWRLAARERLESLVHGPARGLAAALVLGQRDELPAPLWRHARRTGTVHLLALSGLHVGLGAWLLGRALGWLGLGGGPARTGLLVAFVALAGAGPPLQRALVGWCLLTGGRVLGRGDEALPRLALVALLLLAWQPDLVDDLGLHLSVLAVAGLMTMPGPRWLAPVGAVLVTAPLCASTFGEVAWVGVLLTPLLLPLVAGLLALGLVAVVPGPLFAGWDPLWSAGLSGIARLYLDLSEHLAALAPEPLRPRPAALPPVLISLALVAALHCCRRALAGRPGSQGGGRPTDPSGALPGEAR